MGKILKYCSSCDEGFAERFAFCPDCGASLQAFEMNPISKDEVVADAAPTPSILTVEPTASVEASADASVWEQPDITIEEPVDEVPVTPEVVASEPNDVFEPEISAVDEARSSVPYIRSRPVSADEPRAVSQPSNVTRDDDGGYYVTVIQETNVKQRNVLLLGSTFFVISAVLLSWAVSLFQKDLGVGSIGDDYSIALLLDSVPMPVEEEEQQKKDDKDGGGGGGGGREDKEETSQGDLADQSRTPTRPPDAKVFRSDNFELKTPPPQTEGDRKFDKQYDRWGDPNSKFAGPSNGPGTGGGQGTGTGTGQGSGSGTGTGSGTGSGSGSGIGDGNGGGTGSGGSGPPPRAPAVTVNYRILAKPKATYTDAARTNNVQGNVRLKVTLLASGQVGSITPVTRLPHGLTEQAIAAARQIRFEPKKVNGVPVTINVTIDYGFTMY